MLVSGFIKLKPRKESIAAIQNCINKSVKKTKSKYSNLENSKILFYQNGKSKTFYSMHKIENGIA
jgi:hypothetical protein